MREVPIFVINGFLESGKTTLINETLRDTEFNDGGKTLLLLCEEGIEEYDDAAMQIIKTAHETHTPAFDIYVGIYDDNADWCLDDTGWVVSYNGLIQEGEDLFNQIKEWVEHAKTIPPINLNAPIVLPECEIPTTVSEDPDLPF